MFGWLKTLFRRKVNNQVKPISLKGCKSSSTHSEHVISIKSGTCIVLDRVVHGPPYGPKYTTTIQNAEYMGVVSRPSDGFTCLAIRRPSSTKRYFIQVGQVLEIEIKGRVAQFDGFHQKYEQTAAELRDFIEK